MKRTQPLDTPAFRCDCDSFVSCILLTPPAAPSTSKLKLGSSRQAISLRAAPIIHRQRRWPPNRKPPLSNKTTKSASCLALNVTRLRQAADRPRFQGPLSHLHSSHHTTYLQCSAKGGRSRSSGPKVSLELLCAAGNQKANSSSTCAEDHLFVNTTRPHTDEAQDPTPNKASHEAITQPSPFVSPLKSRFLYCARSRIHPRLLFRLDDSVYPRPAQRRSPDMCLGCR